MARCRPVRDVPHDWGVSESAGMMRAFWAGFGLAVLPQLALANALLPRNPLCEVYLTVETQNGLTRIRSVEASVPLSVAALIETGTWRATETLSVALGGFTAEMRVDQQATMMPDPIEIDGTSFAVTEPLVDCRPKI